MLTVAQILDNLANAIEVDDTAMHGIRGVSESLTMMRVSAAEHEVDRMDIGQIRALLQLAADAEPAEAAALIRQARDVAAGTS